MAPNNPNNLPPPQSPFVDKLLNLSYDGYQYLLSLLNIAEQQIPTASVGIGLSARGNTQATATLLTDQWNQIDHAAGPDIGVLLSSDFVSGQVQTVFNNSDGTVTINVYPPPGVQIDALGFNNPFNLSFGKQQNFQFITSALIRSTQF